MTSTAPATEGRESSRCPSANQQPTAQTVSLADSEEHPMTKTLVSTLIASFALTMLAAPAFAKTATQIKYENKAKDYKAAQAAKKGR